MLAQGSSVLELVEITMSMFDSHTLQEVCVGVCVCVCGVCVCVCVCVCAHGAYEREREHQLIYKVTYTESRVDLLLTEDYDSACS